MSRCVLDNEEKNIEVAIGWDPGSESFFARVCDNNACQEAHDAGQENYEEAGVILHTGGFDRVFDKPDVLVDLIQPYACSHDASLLREELLRDQQTNNGDRVYSIDGTEIF